MQPEYVSVADVCALFSIGRSTAYNLLASGQLVGRKIGRRTVVDRKQASEFFHGLPIAKLTPPATH